MKVIKLRDVRKSYFFGVNELKVLRGISLDIKKGEYIAVTGPSGSGKSTLMNILGCLDILSSGTYILNDIDIAGLKDNALSEIRNKEIGFIYQTFNLLMRKNVFDNIHLPLIYSSHPFYKNGRNHKAKLIVEELIKKVGLEDRIFHRPNELSGGQRQRVAIARALVNSPSILLADEPTGNLDSVTTGEIMELFDNLHQEGSTIIIVTHEKDIANHCRRVIHLEDGMVKYDKLTKRK